LKFARSRNVDESEAREELLKAVGRVSEKGPENIKALPAYLFTSYAHRIQRLLAKQKHYASLESVNADLAADPAAARVMQDDLLLAEMVARMNDEMRMILEGLLLGYTFEEIAKKHGKSSNYWRTKFNRA
jgi:DNA-directed RNA polymerase specialized sigma24 family protein